METIREWFFGLGAQYGVNPIIFGAIYVGAIPFFTVSIGWLIRNSRAKKPLALPLLSAATFFVSAYIYLIVVGRHVPAWVYGFLAAVLVGGIISTARRVSRGVAAAEEPEFDVVVIGGGAAGLTAAGIVASLGAKTLLVEGDKLGGDCTWTGCIPSKTLLKAAKVAHEQRHASRYGLADADPPIDSRALMAHVRDVRRGVYEHADAPPIFEAMGIEVRAGRARFVDPHTIAISGPAGASGAGASGVEEKVRARFFIVATGGRPKPVNIAGIEGVSYLTSASIFELEELPKRLIVLGGGPIGCEIAQALSRLGAETTLVQRGGHLLPKDDPELSGMLLRQLEAEGVDVVVEAEAKRVAKDGDTIRMTLAAKGAERTIVADALFVAIGRQPNVEGLDLDKAGVSFEDKGIVVDDRCRTSARHVFACGDVTGRYQLTHMSEHMAKVAATNIMLKLPSKIDTRHVPWCTFTDPELAHVGTSEADLKTSGVAFDVYQFPYDKIDRAVTDGNAMGVLKVFATRGSGKILGATILGESAGDLICELAVAMRNGVTLRRLADTIHPYPTLGLGVRRLADQWYVAKRSRRFVRVLQFLFGFRGPTREFTRGEIV